MAREIERKFRVVSDVWREVVTGTLEIRQGYLSVAGGVSVRVRIVDGRSAALTVKSETGTSPSRSEFEYTIPLADAVAMMALAGDRIIEKRRHMLVAGGKSWSVDVFAGRLSGLVLAEIELGSEDEPFERPGWLGEEVTGNPQFSNSKLAGGGP